MKKSSFIPLVFSLILFCGCASGQPAVPTKTPLPPTATITPTFTPTQTEVPTATTTPVPSGPCDNPLVPLVSGSIYEYQVTTSSGNSMFTLNVGERKDVGNINIEVQIVDHKHAWDITELVVCDEGAIVNFPLYVMSMLMVDSLKGILNTYHYYETGPYAPSYTLLSSNEWIYEWNPGYELEENVTLKNPLQGSDLLIGAMSPIDVKLIMEGNWEPVNVPAGSFPQALEVKVDYHLLGSLIDEGAGCSVTLHTSQWYVPFVGLVSARIDTADMKYLGTIFPVELPSTLELVEFNPGP